MIEDLFMIKTLKIIDTEGTDLNIAKVKHNRSTPNTLSGSKLKSFSSNIRHKSKIPTSLLFFNIALGFQATAIRQEN